MAIQQKVSKIQRWLGLFPCPKTSRKLVDASSSTLTLGGECMTYEVSVEDPSNVVFGTGRKITLE